MTTDQPPKNETIKEPISAPSTGLQYRAIGLLWGLQRNATKPDSLR